MKTKSIRPRDDFAVLLRAFCLRDRHIDRLRAVAEKYGFTGNAIVAAIGAARLRHELSRELAHILGTCNRELGIDCHSLRG